MSVYSEVKKFKKKYPFTVAWRLKKNAEVIEKHLNPDEIVHYVFTGQKSQKFYDFFSTCVVAITSKRILIGRKRVVFGYALDSVMPYMFNDMNVRTRIIWGKVSIDTVKELIFISNIDKDAMPEIETNVSKYMFKLKKKFPNNKETSGQKIN